MRRTSQSEADKQDFIEFITEGTAIQSVKVSSQENARKKVKAKYDKKIVAYMRGREVARDLPMGEMLYVRASVRVYTSGTSSVGLREVMMVITPLTINSDSVRCILWTQEYKSWETEQVDRGILESKRAVKFSDILAWRKWISKDAAFTVNHLYQTPAYKRLAYGV